MFTKCSSWFLLLLKWIAQHHFSYSFLLLLKLYNFKLFHLRLHFQANSLEKKMIKSLLVCVYLIRVIFWENHFYKTIQTNLTIKNSWLIVSPIALIIATTVLLNLMFHWLENALVIAVLLVQIILLLVMFVVPLIIQFHMDMCKFIIYI